jgi:uncharacterized protein with GYD domain
MTTYIMLANYTGQGIRKIKQSPKRLDAARKLAKRYGCQIKLWYLTLGSYDAVMVMDGPNDEAVAKFLLAVGSLGNVRTVTLRAFDEKAFRKIAGAVR